MSSGNNTSQDDPYAYLYDNLVTYFLSWYLPLVLVVGLVGNSFVLVFLIISRMFPKTLLLWFASICVGDLLVLLTDAMRMCVKILSGFDIRDSSLVVCRLHNYLSNFALIWAAYMQTGVSFQRLYLVLRPLHARVHLTMGRVVIGWSCIAIVMPFPYIVYLMFWVINPETGDCEPEDNWFYYVTTLVDLTVWGMIPLISMTIATALIVIKLSRRARDIDQLTGTLEKKSASRPESNRMSTVSQASDPANHMTRVLIGLNLFYMLTTYPLLIYLMYLNFGLENKVGVTIPKSVHRFIYYLLRSLCYLNSSFDWLFYSVSGKVFRQRILQTVVSAFCPSRKRPVSAARIHSSSDATGRQSEHMSSNI